MSRLVSSPQAVLGFASSSRSFREKTEAARSASGGMKRGCKRFGEALSVASGPAFVIEKSHTLPRSLGGWNLDLSRAGVINPKNACGDDANAFPISVLAGNPPTAMMLIHPARPASVQKSTLLSARLHAMIISSRLHAGAMFRAPRWQKHAWPTPCTFLATRRNPVWVMPKT